jgi:hypothetical protein
MGGVTVQIEYTYIENGITITRLKPQKTVEEYRAHTGGLFDDDLIESIDNLTGENNDRANQNQQNER